MRMAAVLALAFVTATPSATAQRRAPADAPWYHRARMVDLTGRSPRDSVVLIATGPRADRLRITLTFFVDGQPVHREEWPSEDELYDLDSLRTRPAKLDAFVRTRLDQVLRLVRREPINAEQVRHMGDAAALRSIRPAPTHAVVYSFAFESSVFLAWDAARRRMVVFMECC
jgi:hypothetical protein